jgi:hypothetical protein
VKRSSTTRRGIVVVALALSACGSWQTPVAERILQEGDCGSVPDIDRLTIVVSDHGAQVAFQWSGTRFAGMVQTSAATLARDASYGTNAPGEWEKRFPGISATTTVPNAYLGFPASSNARIGKFAATVYDKQHPEANEMNRAVAVVDLKTNDTVLLAAPRRVGSIALSPNGEYVAVVEIAPATSAASWRDLFSLQKSAQSPRFDMYATVYSTTGLVACTRDLALGLPSPAVNVAWRWAFRSHVPSHPRAGPRQDRAGCKDRFLVVRAPRRRECGARS